MTAMLLEEPEVEEWESEAPRVKRWTRQEILALHSQGFFANNRIMLLNGVIYKMPTAFPPHDVSLVLLFNYLQSIVPAKCYVRNQLGFGLSPKTDPAPDLAVVDGSIRDHEIDHPSAARLIVEISDSSLSLDLKKKMHLYAAGHVDDPQAVRLDGGSEYIHHEPYAVDFGEHNVLGLRVGRVIGADLSRGMLGRASKRCTKLGLANVETVRADVHALTTEAIGGPVDRLHVFLGMSTFPELDVAFERLWGLLAPGGRAVIVDVFTNKLTFQGRMVNLVARADIRRRSWEQLEQRSTGFVRRDLPSLAQHGGTLFLAVGDKP